MAVKGPTPPSIFDNFVLAVRAMLKDVVEHGVDYFWKKATEHKAEFGTRSAIGTMKRDAELSITSKEPVERKPELQVFKDNGVAI